MNKKAGKSKSGLQALYDRFEVLKQAERGGVELDTGAGLRIALVYPNDYSVGMASMGFQTVYRQFNEVPGVRCERFFLHNPPYDGEMRSLESFERLNSFDIIAFSLSFELDMLNVLKVLWQGHVPLKAEVRTDHDPLVLLGGVVASLNPSPLLTFMDGLLVGEGEGLFNAICGAALNRPRQKGWRKSVREALSELDGFFVPGINRTVKSRLVHDLDDHPVYTPLITPHSHFSDLFVVEVGRGCGRGCFFCAAQKVYSPVRTRSPETLLQTIESYNPGADRIGLESAGLSDYPHLIELCRTLIAKGLGVSFSSVRADKVTPELLDILLQSNTRSFTIAPETGTESLRFLIGKGISDEDILAAAALLNESEIEVLKLYFIIGFPHETEQDIDAIVQLCEKIASIFRKSGKKRQIKISINPFIPKPLTEFQWAAMAPYSWINKMHMKLERELHHISGLTVISKISRLSVWQAVLALGNENLGLDMADMLQAGHSDREIINSLVSRYKKAVLKDRPLDSLLPWSFIDSESETGVLRTRYETYKKKRSDQQG